MGRRGMRPQNCVCPNCGFRMPKTPGVPCRQVNCPNCGSPMMGE